MSKKNLLIYFLMSLLTSYPMLSQTTSEKTFNNKEGISIGTLKDVNIRASAIDSMTTAIQKNEYPNIHSVLIVKNGKLVYEQYFSGKDEILGDPIGVVNHTKEILHDMRSVSKSVVSACIGIAISQGKIKDENQRVFDILTEYKSLDTGQKSSITIKHLLTMTTGLEWDETIPYSDPANYEIQMEKSPDPIQFVLSRKQINPPGKAWNYNGGCTEVLAAIIYKVSGIEVDQFAKKYLFDPLGVIKFEWTRFPTQTTRKDIPAAASGLRLRSRDMLKFGMLYMNKGKWNDKQILPETWVSQSHQFQIDRSDPQKGYGYQFWIEKETFKGLKLHRAVSVGNGGQRISFDHQNELLVITTAGVYNQWDIKNNTDALLFDFIYPSFIKN